MAKILLVGSAAGPEKPAVRGRWERRLWVAGHGGRGQGRSALARGERTAGDLLARTLGHVEPGVLAGLGDAKALLARRRLGLDLGGEQQRGRERGGDGERGLHVGLLG